MPIEFKRTTNVCDRCQKDVSVVGSLNEFEAQQLCSNCYEKTNNEKNLKCPKCKKAVGSNGITEYNSKLMCYKCMYDTKKKEEKTKDRINFFKRNWKFWIMLSIAIIGLVVTYFRLFV